MLECRPIPHGDSSVFQITLLTTPTGGPQLSYTSAFVKPESESLHMSPCHPVCVCVSLSLSWLSRSSSYTRRFNSQSGNDLTSSTPSLLHRSVMLLTARLTLLFVCNCHCPLTANANLCAAVKGAFEFPMGSVLFPAHLMERDWMTPP